MKLFACLLIFVFAVPFCIAMAVEGLKGRDTAYGQVELASVAQPGGSSEYRVAVDGYLLRTVPPDAARMGKGRSARYVLPFVSEAEANAALESGLFAYSPDATPVFVEASGGQLPVEIFMRADGARPDPVAVPFTFEGTESLEGTDAPPVVRRIPGAGGGREIVLLKSKKIAPLSQGAGIGFGIAACVFLWLGRRVFRSWRRDRREHKERVERIIAERAGRIIPRAADSAPPKPVSSGGGIDVPWGKIAGVFVVIGVIGAKVGKHAGSSVDDLARGVMRSADEVGSLGRSADSLTPGERAMEAVGTALDVESAVETVNEVISLGEDAELAGPTVPATRASKPSVARPLAVRLDLKVTDSDEIYFAEAWSAVGTGAWAREGSMELDLTPPAGEPLRFLLAKVSTEAELSGSVAGSRLERRAGTSVEVPDRSRGEFTSIELRPAGDGVHLTHVIGLMGELGYVDVFRATGQLEFLNGRTWADLCSTGLTATLGFTEAGQLEYARTMAPSYARAAEISLGKQALTGLRLQAEFTTPAVEFLEIHKGRLILSQRNVSEVRIWGNTQ